MKYDGGKASRISLRDHYAGLALAGMLADISLIIDAMKLDGDKVFDWTSEAAYKWADAMLKQKHKE